MRLATLYLVLSHACVVRRRLLGTAHHEVAATYNNLANLLRKPPAAGKRIPTSQAAEQSAALVDALYRRAIAIREATLGPHSPQLAASLSNLAVFITHMNEERQLAEHVDEAEQLLRRGLAIRRSVFGDEHCARFELVIEA